MGLTQSSLIVTVSLREYLLGRLHILAWRAFERYMDPFVKKIMLAKYPLSEVEKQSIADFKTTQDQARQKLQNLPTLTRAAELEKDSAKAAMPSTAPKNLNMLKQKITTANRKLRELKKFKENFEKTKQYHQKTFNQPRYVRQCRSAVGGSMKQFVTFDRHWDMFTHAAIISEYMSDIFAEAIGCGPYQFEFTELFDKLRQASWARTWRAHPEEYEKPREAQVLDFLETMYSVLKLCGCDDGAREVRAVLGQAQDLMQKATLSVLPTPATISLLPHVYVTLSLDEFEQHILYVAWCEFKERLQGLVGKFIIEDGNIRVPGAEAGKSIWSTAWQKRVNAKHVTQAFKRITLARNALFHHGENEWKHVDVSLALKAMGQVLRWLHPGPRPGGQDPPAGTWGPTSVDWTHHLRLGRAKSAAEAVNPASVTNAVIAATVPPPATSNQIVHLRVRLQLSVGGMDMPIEREPNFVGREQEIAALKKALEKDGARVLVHGVAGVGKDRLVAEVWRDAYVETLPGISMFITLQGSTDSALRQQLIECFLTHQSKLLRGREHDPQACLELIHRWLRRNRGWFIFVQGGTSRCRALFDCLPLNAPHGRVVVTSKERLDLNADIAGIRGTTAARVGLPPGKKVAPVLPARTRTINLKELELRYSKQIWRNMNIFSSFVTKDIVRGVREEDLRQRCEASGGQVEQMPAPAGETPESANRRHNLWHKALQRLKPPAARETIRAAKTRLKVKAMKELENKELASDELNKFLNDTLGNLPLSVRLCGQVLHHIGNTRALIKEFKSVKLDEANTKYRNAKQDRRYFGLAKLVIIGVRRMCTFCDNADARVGKTGSKKAAIGLLMALSLLHESVTPRHLFQLSPDQLREAWVDHQSRLAEWTSSGKGKPKSTKVRARVDDCPFADLFSESETAVETFDRACAVLRQFGFLRRANVPSHVGVMHPLVQLVVRNHFIMGVTDGMMVPPGWALALVETLESVLIARYDYTAEERWYEHAVARVQALSPCVETWCTVFWDMDTAQEGIQRLHCQRLCRLRSACILRGNLGELLRQIEHSPKIAMRHHTAVQKMQEQLCLEGDHRDIASSRNNLGRTLHDLGENKKALEIQKPMVKMYQRLYPYGDNPKVAIAMSNLGLTLHAVGRSREAIQMHKKAMVVYLELYSEGDHPHMAMALNNLGNTLDAAEETWEAVKFQKPALEMYKRLYPEGDHPDVVKSMNSLALTLHGLNETQEAFDMQTEALEIYKRLYKDVDHPNIAKVLNAMGHTQKSRGNTQEAHKLMTFGLEMRKRLYPERDHADVARSMNSLALAKHALGNFREAVLMQRDSLSMFERVYSKGDHEDIAMVVANIGQTLSAIGKYETALIMQKKVVDMNKRMYAFDHQDTLTAMNCMALTLYCLYKYQEALSMQQEVLAMAKRLHPNGDHQNIATCMSNLTLTLEALGREDEALRMREEVLEIDKRIYQANDHPKTATAIDNLASIKYSSGKKIEAVKLWQKAIDMRRRLYPSGDHPLIAMGLNNLAKALRSVGSYDITLNFQRQVLAMRKRLYPDGVHQEICEIMSEMGHTLHQMGRIEEALEVWKELLPLSERLYPEGLHVNIASAMSSYAMALELLGELQESLKMKRGVLEMVKKIFPKGDDPSVPSATNSLGDTLHDLGQYPEARELQEQAVELYKRMHPGGIHKDIAMAMYSLGETLHQLKKHDEAFEVQKQVLDMRKRLFPEGHSEIVHAAKSLSKTAKSLISLGRMQEAYAIMMQIQHLDPDIARSFGKYM